LKKVVNKSLCHKEVRSFNLLTSTWKILKPKSFEPIPSPRRSHIAVIARNELFVHGGIDQHGRYLSDVWGFDILKPKWQRYEVMNDVGPLVFH